MAGAAYEVEGARELRRTLKAAGDDLADLKAANLAAAATVAGRARGTAPMRTGRLAGSVRPSGTKTAGVVRAGSRAVPYAQPIHWGWPRHNITAQPWITEAAQDTEGAWVNEYQAAVEKILDRVKGV